MSVPSGRTPSVAEICSEVCDYLRLNLREEGISIDESTGLTNEGIDSFALMELLLFLEKRFAQPFPLEKLTEANTQSVRALAECYSEILAARA